MIRKIRIYFYKWLGFFLKQLCGRDLYMACLKRSLELGGVRFTGTPRFIHQTAYLDPIGGLTLGDNIVISAGVIILTHDYSYTTGLISIGKKPKTDMALLSPVIIGDNCFIGAGAIILPGSRIGSNVIVAGGSVVKGKVRGNTVIAGNPAERICNTDDWAAFRMKTVSEENVLIDKK